MNVGAFKRALPNARFLTSIAALVIVLFSGFMLALPRAEAANDVSLGLTLQDTNANGEINRIVLSIDNDALETWTVNGTPGITVTQGGSGITVSSVAISGSASADPVVVHIALDESDADLDVDTDSVNSNAMEVVYVQAGGGSGCTNCIRDTGAELTAFATGDAGAANTEVDDADPLIVSQSPASGATNVNKFSTVEITFTEPINTSTDSIASSPVVTLASAWTNSDKTVTLTPSPSWSQGTYTITVSTASDVAASPNSFGGAISGSATHPWSFTVNNTTGGYIAPSVVKSAVTITSPEAGDDFYPADRMLITWESVGTAPMGAANIYYSIDGGMLYTSIVKGITNDGSYEWTVPVMATTKGHIKVEGTDGVVVLASDESDAFAIITDSGESQDGEEEDDATEDQIEAGEVMGTSPVTGEMEVIDDVDPGDYIRGVSFDTVYWVDSDMVRHPFFDTQTYFTYQNSFDAVVEVSDATLSTLQLGSPILPKAGVVLVKIRSVDQVYALENNSEGETELRWIASEEVAEDMYGSDWASYVIDIDVTLFGKFAVGDGIDAAIEVDTSIMKTRMELNSY